MASEHPDLVRSLEVVPDPDALARRGAAVLAERIAAGATSLALSGGATPTAMLRHLAALDVAWAGVELWQVDERVVSPGDTDRNLTHLLASLPAEALVHAMPVDDDDLEAAAARYAATLPVVFDLVHLGLGADGHTASLLPGDPASEVTDRDVVFTAQSSGGYRRMTITLAVLARAREVMWVVSGRDKAAALRRLLRGDVDIPAGRVACARQIVLADHEAAADASAGDLR